MFCWLAVGCLNNDRTVMSRPYARRVLACLPILKGSACTRVSKEWQTQRCLSLYHCITGGASQERFLWLRLRPGGGGVCLRPGNKQQRPSSVTGRSVGMITVSASTLPSRSTRMLLALESLGDTLMGLLPFSWLRFELAKGSFLSQ